MTVIFTLFKDSEGPFLAMLDSAGIEYDGVGICSGTVMASGNAIAIAQTVAASTALASVLIAWIKSRASRKVIITTSDNKTVHAEGYSLKELEQILAMTQRVAVIDTKPADKTVQGNGT